MNYWWFLFLFLLVPLLVHLFSFRRAKKVYFTAVQFISKLKSESKSKSRLKYFLILGNRIGLFASLLGILWFFYTPSNENIYPQTVLYFDNSVSSLSSTTPMSVDRYAKQLEIENNGGGIHFILNTENKFMTESFDYERSKEQTNFPKGLRIMYDLMSKERGSYHLLSDFQLQDLKEMRNFFKDTTSHYTLIRLNDLNKEENIFVDSLYIIPSLTDVNKLSVHVKFKNYRSVSGNLVIRLLLEGNQISSVVQKNKLLDVVIFDIPKNKGGNYEIHFEGDKVMYDNTFYFTIENKSRLKIALLEGSNTKFLREAFGNEELFEVKTYTINSLAYEFLKEADLIVVNDFQKLPTALFQQLPNAFFLILPADTIDITTYKSVLDLPIKFVAKEQHEIDFDFSHPLFKDVFEKNSASRFNLYSKPIVAVEGVYEPIIRYRSRNPFLLKKENFFFLNGLLNKNSTFQSSALFIPILYQLVFSIADPIKESYYYPKSYLSLPLQPLDVPVRIVGLDFEYIPEFQRKDNQLILALPSDISPGKYVLMRGQDTLKQLSVNLPKSESEMLAPTIKDMKEEFSSLSNVTIIDANDTSSSATLLVLDAGVPLWKYALILTLLFIMIETVLHRYLK